LGLFLDKKQKSIYLSFSDIEFKLEIPVDLWACRVDPKQMAQAVKNLIINAREAVVLEEFIEVIL